MLTDQHIAEALSRAYVRAIAGRAGLNLAIREYDYGVDGSFDEVVVRQNRRVESGFSLSFQLKASTQWQLDSTHVIYDLEAKTYNDLILRRSTRAAIPCILILLALPPDSRQWLICEESELRMKGTCYWEYLSGNEGRKSRLCQNPHCPTPTPHPRIFANLNGECQNRRVVMIPQVLSNYPQMQEIRVAEVVNYLQQNYWMAISHPNPRLLVFEKGVDEQGKPIQIVLPSQDDYEDKPYLLTKAVNLLSVLQSASFQEIVEAIHSDVQAS